MELSLTQKLITVFQLFIKSNTFISVALFAVVEAFIVFICLKVKKKDLCTIYILSCINIIIILFGFYGNTLLIFGDRLMDSIFNKIYTPTFSIYIFMIICSSVILTRDIIKKKDRTTKAIDVIFCSMICILFFMVIEYVMTNKINIYIDSSIYTNKQLLALLELSMQLFAVWTIIIVLRWSIDKVTFKLDCIEAGSKLLEKKPNVIQNEELIVPVLNVENMVFNEIEVLGGETNVTPIEVLNLDQNDTSRKIEINYKNEVGILDLDKNNAIEILDIDFKNEIEVLDGETNVTPIEVLDLDQKDNRKIEINYKSEVEMLDLDKHDAIEVLDIDFKNEVEVLFI